MLHWAIPLSPYRPNALAARALGVLDDGRVVAVPWCSAEGSGPRSATVSMSNL